MIKSSHGINYYYTGGTSEYRSQHLSYLNLVPVHTVSSSDVANRISPSVNDTRFCYHDGSASKHTP